MCHLHPQIHQQQTGHHLPPQSCPTLLFLHQTHARPIRCQPAPKRLQSQLRLTKPQLGEHLVSLDVCCICVWVFNKRTQEEEIQLKLVLLCFNCLLKAVSSIILGSSLVNCDISQLCSNDSKKHPLFYPITLIFCHILWPYNLIYFCRCLLLDDYKCDCQERQ